MDTTGRRVAIVGMGGAFPNCTDLNDFNRKLFAGESLIRDWPEALAHGKNIRSTISGYITEAEMGLEPITRRLPKGTLKLILII